jgi:excisionase family DNA binding protein
MTVEIVKAQAAQRRMSAQEIEEYIRRTAAALQSITSPPSAPLPSPEEEAAPAPAGERMLTVEEAARLLGRTPLTVYKYIRQGKLQAQRAGRAYRLRPEDVQALKGTLRRRVVVRARRPARRPMARRRRVARKA